MIPCVRFKSGVTLDPLTPALARLLTAVDMAARVAGYELTVSCGREGHSENDPHTLGKAIDVRARDLTPEQVLTTHHDLRQILPSDLFFLQYETPATPTNGALRNIAVVNPGATAPHFHLQVRHGQVYPPQDADTSAVRA